MMKQRNGTIYLILLSKKFNPLDWGFFIYYTYIKIKVMRETMFVLFGIIAGLIIRLVIEFFKKK